MFEIVVSGHVHWNEPPIEFSDRGPALGHAKGILGRLIEMGAPDDATVSVLREDVVVASYSVVSWRMAVKFIGGRAYR